MSDDYTIRFNKCKHYALCFDCDDNTCLLSGKLISDCPKNRCDRPDPHIRECETCEFLREYQKEKRKHYDKHIGKE